MYCQNGIEIPFYKILIIINEKIIQNIKIIKYKMLLTNI